MCQKEEELKAVVSEIEKFADREATTTEANRVKEKLTDLNGEFDLSKIDWSKSGKEILASIQPQLQSSLEIARIKAQEKAVEALETLDTKTSTETIPMLWPTFSGGIKALIVLMVLFFTAFCGLSLWMQYQAATPDFTELLITLALYAVVMVGMVTWPIKSLAAKSLEAATIVAAAKMEKATSKKSTQ